MATKKTTKRAADKQRQNSGKFGKGNLYAFKPGRSGNPDGRPPSKKYLSEALREWLAAPSADIESATNADVLAAVIGGLALKGDLIAIREIADRTEGRAKQALDVTTHDDRENKAQLYERLVARIIERAQNEFGQALTRVEAINQIAVYKPEIKEYIN